MIIIVEVKDKCRKCGAKVSPGYDFCLSCGTKFSEIPPTTQKRRRKDLEFSSTGVMEEKAAKRAKKTRRRGIIFMLWTTPICIIIGFWFPTFYGVAAFSFICGLLIYLLGKKQLEKTGDS